MNTLILKPNEDKNALRTAAERLKRGGLVVIPTETVYGLAANALDEKAVEGIFKAKGRPQDNPLIVHIYDFDEIYSLAREIPEKAKALAEKFWPGALTVILPKTDRIPQSVSAGLDTVAIRMPSHPAAREIIRLAGVPLAAPSANISGFPSPTSFLHVFDDLNGRVDAIVDGGDCDIGVESAVISFAAKTPRLLRPGGISREQIEEVIGEIEVDEAVLKPLREGAEVTSPGMKHKHYSPLADVAVVKGSLDEFIRYVKRHKEEGVMALCFEGEEKQIPLECVTMGAEDKPFSQTKNLFKALRELDARGAKRVYARCPSQNGVGLAVCNRLFRAANFEIINGRKPIIGLTGPTGAGKSIVASMLAEKGCEIIDCDRISREIYLPGSAVNLKLAEVFGSDILASNGEVNRAILAEKAFSSPQNTEKLNAITHPAILEISFERAEAAIAAGKAAVIDAAALFESGADAKCDFTAVVIAPVDIRLKRILARDRLSEKAALSRINAQREELYYCERADYIIRNYPPYKIEEEIIKITERLGEFIDA